MQAMHDVALYVALAAFLVMGLGAIVRPDFIVAQFDVPRLTHAGRSEVRAVYGGYGIAMAGMLVVALRAPTLREGVCFTTAMALVGMASGRIVSLLRDRRMGRFPLFYLGVEVVFAALLWFGREPM